MSEIYVCCKNAMLPVIFKENYLNGYLDCQKQNLLILVYPLFVKVIIVLNCNNRNIFLVYIANFFLNQDSDKKSSKKSINIKLT